MPLSGDEGAGGVAQLKEGEAGDEESSVPGRSSLVAWSGLGGATIEEPPAPTSVRYLCILSTVEAKRGPIHPLRLYDHWYGGKTK